MGFYAERVLPRMLDALGGAEAVQPLRRRVCAGLTGQVVEIGFGAGHNVPFYPPAVTSVAAVEPSDLGWGRAETRVRAARVPIRRSGLDGQSLPAEDDTFDCALSTWTLCTIPDAVAALRELRRVLKPGGSLHFLEHGLAPGEDEDVRRRQRRLEPLQRRVFGGCRLTREPVTLLTSAGFVVESVDVFYQQGGPRFLSALSLGIAVAPHGPAHC